MEKRAVVTGSLAYDHIMSMPGRFANHIQPDKIHILNISFTMDSYKTGFGGTGGNIAYSLAKLGIPTVLAATAGNDFDKYQKHLDRLDKLTCIIKIYRNTTTAAGFVFTDKDDNQIWSFFAGAMKYASEIRLDRVLQPGDVLMIAPNHPAAMLKYAVTARKNSTPYVFDPAFNIPHFKTADLLTAIRGSTVLIGNDYEIGLICRRLNTTKAGLADNNRIVITTLGAAGSEIVQRGRTYKIPAARVKNTSDPTGAGDAYRAGFLAGYIRGLKPETCGKMGAVSAAYTVEKTGTQTHSFTPAGFERRYRTNFGNNRRLLIR